MTAVALQTPADIYSEYGTLQFIIQQMLFRMETCTLVKVIACTRAGGVAPWGTVDVQPLISQVAGSGQVVPHKPLYRLPYLRLQGGANAIIMDPEPGDIGLACFASRDISAMKQQSAIDAVKGGEPGVPPGRGGGYDISDGLYVGGYLNGTPTQYVAFSADGIAIHSPVKVRITAPIAEVVADTRITLQAPLIELKGVVDQTDGDVSMGANVQIDGNLNVDGNISGG